MQDYRLVYSMYGGEGGCAEDKLHMQDVTKLSGLYKLEESDPVTRNLPLIGRFSLSNFYSNLNG